MVRVCFVCLGNICRSPTAEGIMRHIVREAGLGDHIEIDSAGTGGWHVGERPDRRARSTAKRRGINLTSTARQFRPDDFERFDYIVAMDRDNLSTLRELAVGPKDAAKLSLLRAHDRHAPAEADVPDPYYGGPRGFDEVFDICESACAGLLERIRRDHAL